jgi:predicted nucleotidyltransferase
VLVGVRRDLVEANREAINAAVRRHRGRSVALFGSAARGDDAEHSDIDLLVEFEPDSSLFDLAHLTDELEALLGCKVDVVSRGGLKERDQRILSDAVPL